MENVGKLLVGLVLIVFGVMNIGGNVSMVHSYNRKRVREEDIPKYGTVVGIGTLIIGLSLIVAGIAAPLTGIAENTIALPGFLAGLAFILYGQIKYNKGLF